MIPRGYAFYISVGIALWTLIIFFFSSPQDRFLPKDTGVQTSHDPQAHESLSSSLLDGLFTDDSKKPLAEDTQAYTGSDAPQFSPEARPLVSEQKALGPAFTGAFERIPRISELAPNQKRISIIIVWNGNDNPGYLRHFLHGIQLNADSLDLLFINRKWEQKNVCLDFEKEKLNITWGGNIKVVCMDDADWKKRHVDFMCSKEYGWNCNAQEYKDVTAEFATRRDKKNYDWRLFRGWVARDLLQHPENPFWGWMDTDVIPGNFKRYPFNLLSQMSFLTGDSQTVGTVFMLMGQLTTFNYDDKFIASAWKGFPEMQTAAHFTQHKPRRMPDEPEEKYWSHGYLSSSPGQPGEHLNWGMYPDIHGDDFFDGKWRPRDASQIYVVSGRDILLVDTTWSREQIEELIRLERSEPVDDLGSVGWTAGDGALTTKDFLNTSCSIEDTPTWNPRLKNCVDLTEIEPFIRENPAVYRPSWIRFNDQPENIMWRRLERDTRARGYERKLIKHHLWSKKQTWWEFPPFDITENLVYRYNVDVQEVWRMGATRNDTLFYRKLVRNGTEWTTTDQEPKEDILRDEIRS